MPHILRCGGRGRQTPPTCLWKAAALRRVRLREEKKAHSHTQPRAKEKRTAKAGRAQITLRASASGMAKAQEQRIAYLTYPVRAGITVTFSRGLSPHSAASPARPARRPVIQFSSIVRHVAANCKSEFALRRFFSCAVGQRLSPAPRSALTSPPAGWLAEPKMSCHAASTLAASSCASFASSAVLSSGLCPRISSAT